MGLRHLASALTICVVASAAVRVAAAPKDKKTPAKKTPVAPAKDAGSAAGSDTTPATPDEPPPKDMNGTDENPDRPHAVGMDDTAVVAVAPKKMTKSGYPIEEALRPLTLPQNMTEVQLDPHAMVSTFANSTSLRARYGITNKVQLGLTYAIGGIFDDPQTLAKTYAFHAGKAVGLDVTYQLQDWIAVRLGVPVYIDPLAVSITVGVPIKFVFADKLAIGGLDDLLSIAVDRFPPSFYQEAYNAAAVNADMTHTTQSSGDLRFSGYGIYQYQPNTAFIGRIGFDVDDFSSNIETNGHGGITTFLFVGVQHTPRKFVDIGGYLGFDDLAHGGSFDPQIYLRVRI
jgi:hypothetical protein